MQQQKQQLVSPETAVGESGFGGQATGAAV